MIVRRRRPWGMGYTAEVCQSWDSPCVERNMVKSVAEQQQAINDHLSDIGDQCEVNANRNSEPFRSQMLAECGRRETINLQQPTAQQAGIDYTNAWAAQAEQVRQELLRAGQTFIPDNVKPGGYIAPVPVATVPGVKTPAVVINSSGGQSAPLTLDAQEVIDQAQSAASGLPWYVWAGGAAVVLMVMRGGGR